VTADQTTWTDANQRYMMAALARIHAALERQRARLDAVPPPDIEEVEPSWPDDGSVPTLVALCQAFGLSPFERDTLLLCAGMELQSRFAPLCAAAQGDPARPYPTFSLALAALDAPNWGALTPDAPLRHWRLIEIAQQPGVPLTTSPLRIDERILHFLTGLQYLDERLVGLVEPIWPESELIASHLTLAQRIGAAWTRAQEPLPLIQLCGADETCKREIAATGCAAVGLRLFCLHADSVPANASEFEGLARLWERETALTSCALYVAAETIDLADARVVTNLTRLLERIRGPLLLSVRDRWRALRRPILTLEVDKPSAEEQRELWQALLGDQAARLNGHVDGLVAQFNLSVPAIRSSVEQALGADGTGDQLATELWAASRAQARPRLDDMAQRIAPIATWDALILPDAEQRLLHEIANQVAQRTTVYETWGFAAASSRGMGISALFAGPSGTGKTMAAEVLANALRLDLYLVDLSGVVSKYIGETEKNLRRVFDAAEDGGAILFFDEADALFGKRSEVKDSHDRYANIEINYLLQRMESYRGLAVLATNRKGDIDPAFLRRIRFMVSFPFPETAQRIEIWRRVFPPQTPTEGLDLPRLARLNIAGGNIRNIALNGAFLAAGNGEPVRMAHLLQAARIEYAKIEKPLNAAEIGGWA